MTLKAPHIVLDLETRSTKPNAIGASIGAVAIGPDLQLLTSEFHIPLAQHMQFPRHEDSETMRWWSEQSQEARFASIMAAQTVLPGQAQRDFAAWVHSVADPEKVKVCGNGSVFDNVILRSLYDMFNQPPPWERRFDRDIRTILDLHPAAKDVGEFVGVKHIAVDDARHEAKQLVKALSPHQGLMGSWDAR
ncbi:3'-5' exonuclease [Comamonas guangdongensis]|uniref:3'-5' exonuclease n=1 Tax=Comamonas guangdongensis TaxID=510515 RepID=A0ABV3ZQB0_9BURK